MLALRLCIDFCLVIPISVAKEGCVKMDFYLCRFCRIERCQRLRYDGNDRIDGTVECVIPNPDGENVPHKF
jgi:hypothetical protein